MKKKRKGRYRNAFGKIKRSQFVVNWGRSAVHDWEVEENNLDWGSHTLNRRGPTGIGHVEKKYDIQ